MAIALAKAGAAVVCAARTQSQIDETVDEILSLDGTATAVSTDVTCSEQVDALVASCAASFGRIDIMLANAGAGTSHTPFWEYTDEEFELALALNLKSTFYCGRAAARAMIAGKHGGSIINVSSLSAYRANPIFAYPTAKGGVLALGKSQAKILSPYGIRVNTIVPGLVPQSAPRDDVEADHRRRIGGRMAVGRVGECWELGPLAVYLASDASSYVTGANFIIDGGDLAGGIAPSYFEPYSDLEGGTA